MDERNQLYLNWEITSGRTMPDSDYIRDLGIKTEAVKTGVYLTAQPMKSVLSDVYASVGCELGTRKNWAKAISNLEKAEKINPDSWIAYGFFGDTYLAMGQPEKAISFYNLALKKNPDLDWVYLERGRAYLEANKPEVAIADLRRAADIKPLDPKPAGLLAKAYLKSNNCKQASFWIKKAIKAESDKESLKEFRALEKLIGS
ncbi:MAG: tetratricopeptide repeat protein [Candidatus Riflebacteria bacterium]|nr:tetratricopeptide repeat protein [Candidatus Riflebacteria bacterium]